MDYNSSTERDSSVLKYRAYSSIFRVGALVSIPLAILAADYFFNLGDNLRKTTRYTILKTTEIVEDLLRNNSPDISDSILRGSK